MISKHVVTTDRVMLALCNKRLSRVAILQHPPLLLPSRHSLSYAAYKQHMEILVRISASVLEGQNICWYCGQYVRWSDEDAVERPTRQIKLWEGASKTSIRARFCPTCAKMTGKSRTRVQHFYQLSWVRGDAREWEHWDHKVDEVVSPIGSLGWPWHMHL